MGHICVYGSESSFDKSDQKMLILLCKVVAYEMLYRGLSVSNEIPYYTLLSDLLDGKLQDGDELRLRQQCLGLQFPKQMTVLTVAFRSPMVQTTVFYLREYLLRQIENALGIVYEGNILLLVPETALTDRLLEDSLAGYETNVDYRVGISDPTAGLEDLRIFYRQAMDALRIAGLLKLEGRLCFYQQLKIYQILLCAGKELDLRYLCSPVVLRMLNYDRQYNTEYLKDLEIYLECGKNMNKAAARACVHKNSMYYRISKMTELFSFSLEDEEVCFLLRLSLKILRLLEP